MSFMLEMQRKEHAQVSCCCTSLGRIAYKKGKTTSYSSYLVQHQLSVTKGHSNSALRAYLQLLHKSLRGSLLKEPGRLDSLVETAIGQCLGGHVIEEHATVARSGERGGGPGQEHPAFTKPDITTMLKK